MRGTPEWSRPSEGGGSERGGGAGRPAFEEAEAESGRVGGTEGRVEAEGRFLRCSL